MTTANCTLIAIADAARARSLNIGPGTDAARELEKIARELRAFAILGDTLPLTIDDAEHAFLWLGQANKNDDAATVSRRAMCRTIAELARGSRLEFVGGADPNHLIAILERVMQSAKNWEGPDMVQLAATCAREVEELRSHGNAV